MDHITTFTAFPVLFVFMFIFLQTSAEPHSLQFLYTAVTKGINLPEFIAVGQVDGEQVIYFNSNNRTLIPKTEWIKKDSAVFHWNDQKDRMWGDEADLKQHLNKIMEQFNHNTGIHTMQRMYGCELDDDGTIRGYEQYGYDGEDFLILDLKTLTWTAATDKTNIIKQKFEKNGYTMHRKDYLEKDCIDWLKKCVSYGRETLERKVPPEALMFQKFSSSPELVCHATGFFPKGLNITWQKDGEDLIENMELRETLPNQDGSFQKRSILKVSPEDLQKHEYTCVIKHSSLKEDLVLKARERRILRGGGSGGVPIGIIVGAVVGVLALVLIVAGILVWKKKKSGFKPVPSKAGLLSETLCSVTLVVDPGLNVTLWCQHDLNYGGYIFWFKNTTISVPHLLGCKQFASSSQTQNCFFLAESERILMSVDGKNTSLTIRSVDLHDTGFYYCSFCYMDTKEKHTISSSSYLHVKEGNQTLIQNLDGPKGADVFFMHNVIIGAVIVILFCILIFMSLKCRNTHRYSCWSKS